MEPGGGSGPVRPPGSIARHRLGMRARQRAKTALAQRHPEEYQELIAEAYRALEKEGAHGQVP